MVEALYKAKNIELADSTDYNIVDHQLLFSATNRDVRGG